METSESTKECHPAQKLINSMSPYDSYSYKPYPVQQKIDPSDPLYDEYQRQASAAARTRTKQQSTEEDPSNYDIKKATQFGAFERVKQLVDEGQDVNQLDSDGVSLLHWAAINNKKPIASLYIEHGAVIDKLGGILNSTPLHWATRQGHLSMVVYLMAQGADPTIVDGEGYQCLHLASMFSHSSIVAYLLAKGYDVDTPDRSGMTPLMWACYRTASTDPIRLLLRLGADVNKKDATYGNTALHWSILVGNHTALGQLTKHNVDLNALNLAGERSLDVAVKKGNRWLADKIRKTRLERGFDNPGYFQARTTQNRDFRTKYMIAYPFFALWGIGWAFEIDYSWAYWWMRLLLLGFVFLSFRYSKQYIFDERLGVTIPFGLYLATKFWMYFTWFFYAFHYIDNFIIHALFLLNSGLLSYHFYKAVTNDPGFIKPSREQQYRTILDLAERETITLDQFCSTCLIKKPLRSKHCSTCDKCVAKFDHHCPWIYNCVGAGNMKHFILYLTFLIGMILWCMFGCFTYWRNGCTYSSESHTISTAISCSPWVTWIFLNCCVHLVFVGILLANLLYQAVYLGLTTNEKLNLYRYKHFHKDGKFHNPYSHGIIQNCVDELQCGCFGLFRPSFTDWYKMFKSPDEATTV